MNFKKLAVLIEMLSVTCLVSVGFSSWLVTSTSNYKVVGNVESYDIINSNDYIVISNMIISDYNESGFFTDYIYSDGVSNICKFEYDVTMNYNKYMTDIYGDNKNNWGNSKKFNFEFDLCYSEEVSVRNVTNEEWKFFDILGRSSNSSIQVKYGYDEEPSLDVENLEENMKNNVSLNDYSITNFDENPSFNCEFNINNVPSSTKYINMKMQYYFTITDYNKVYGDYLALVNGIPFSVNFIVMEV